MTSSTISAAVDSCSHSESPLLRRETPELRREPWREPSPSEA